MSLCSAFAAGFGRLFDLEEPPTALPLMHPPPWIVGSRRPVHRPTDDAAAFSLALPPMGAVQVDLVVERVEDGDVAALCRVQP